jgi:hypothetical protein
MKAREFITEAWSQKYKSSINCSHPKGFSQKAHCAGKKKHNESIEMEMVCEDCGMCRTHGSIMELKTGAKDSNGVTRCWPGKHAVGTKTGKNGGQVRNCQPNESVEEAASAAAVQAATAIAMKAAGKKPKSMSEGICSLEEAHAIFDDFEQAMAERGLTEDAYDTITDEDIIRETAAWRRSAGKSKKGGLNRKGIASYRREHPGSHLQMAVTTKPSKLKPGSKAAKRRKSFCARMSGVQGPMKKPNGKPTRKALALRKWNC